MARAPSPLAALRRLFSRSKHPMYALDERRQLVFANDAFSDWTRVPVDQLLGMACHYGVSEADSSHLSILAASLCPPPDATFGGQIRIVIEAPVPDSSQITWSRRAATLLSWTDDNTLEGVFVMLDLDDVPAGKGYEVTGMSSEMQTLHRQVSQLRYLMPRHATLHLLGDSALMHRVRQQVEAAAETAASVLILGDVGTGREEVAKAVYYGGDATRGLLPLSCRLLDAELLASALEDLERSHLELMETPDAILLLDVDQLPVEAQEPIYQRLRQLQPSPRILATAQHRLDRDGFHRGLAIYLSELVIQLPSLADRREDIPQLAQCVVQDANAERPRQLGGFDADALDLLVTYPWFENHDELMRFVRAAALDAKGSHIVATDLPFPLHAAQQQAAHPIRRDEPIDLPVWLEAIERDVIQRAMERAKGNKAQAARLLGLQRSRLLRRLEALGLNTDNT